MAQGAEAQGAAGRVGRVLQGPAGCGGIQRVAMQGKQHLLYAAVEGLVHLGQTDGTGGAG